MTNSELAQMHWQHHLLSSIEVGIIVLNHDFVVEVWNQFMENHSDILPSGICGTSLFEHFPEIDEKWLRAKADPVFTLSSPVFLIWEQRPYLFKFGSNRPITSDSEFMFQNVTMFPLTSPSGNVEKMCLMIYDVTDQALSKRRVERLNEELKIMSRIDGLTGLYNRRYWQERFDMKFKLAKRRDKPVTAMMLDIDHFKKVNDTYGHQAGDRVIQALANVIKCSVRETDLAGRYGGEEFAIVLTDTDAKNAHTVAERIRSAAEATTVAHDGNNISFTVSLGLSEYGDHCQSAMEWLELADQALYDAKVSGRNQIIAKNLPD
ncbi:sensor domain-containing diguanylate cyclase [Alteromonas sp. ASW11-130]|uniref:sensor domain-containing diguanylate cyclase n=1 Tax=Alteromonas sp. ASW11-130 TaxID=3015775 RepID=UPI00224275BF|nr:sensor domain-containing diguanylate cyclase [Alteromonas sp. ASW11-130]MCW8091849.1 GGDEF domain-containing protein [Alteromonas sp. ASW11-130]